MNSQHTLRGIHHLTAITSSATTNIAFYEKVLGLRLVKQTVNFDDPSTYHLYYGDQEGNPGSILTFFLWTGLPHGRNGAGMVTALAFEIPTGSASHWQERLHRHHIRTIREVRFGDEVLVFSDPHGLILELVASGDQDTARDTKLTAAPDYRLRGFHSATALLRSLQGTKNLLVHSMGMEIQGQEGNRVRFRMNNDDSLGLFYDLVVDPEAETGQQGSGSVHHIAFRTPSDAEQQHWQHSLRADGYQVTAVRDRKYFKSIYFHEPGGVLFEIATDPPGFTVDEPLDRLGHALQLPEQFASGRAENQPRTIGKSPHSG